MNETSVVRLKPGSPFGRLLFFLAVAAGSFLIYMSNGQTLASYDSAPNSLLAFNLLQNRRLDFDLFRRSYFSALGGQYAFVEAPNGHLTSVFPIGAAIVTLPLYVALYFVGPAAGHAPAIESPAFEPVRQHDEKFAAAVVAALSVGLFFLCAREIGNRTQAAIATIVYALGTSMWSIGSQALWQHGPVNAFVLAMVYALVGAVRAHKCESARLWLWLAAAGLCAGLLPVIRPTAVLFSIAGTVFAGRTFPRRWWLFVAGLLIGAAPAVAWNAYFFHSLLGGYAGDARSYGGPPGRALVALGGLLVSPSRGLFVFSPVLVFSLFGAVNAWRICDRYARLVLSLAAASAVLVLQYAFYRSWWAGYAYGPRFLTDIAAVAALLLVYALPPRPLAAARGSAGTVLAASAFLVLGVFSITVQFAGVNSGAAGSEWNAVPVSVDRQPSRVWDISDSQIERNMRAAYVRFFAWNIARTSAYDRGLAARVTAIEPFAAVTSGTSIDASARLSNDGESTIYGYDSGVYIGQLRVRVRITTPDNQLSSQQYLYVMGSPAAGERTRAIGTIELPREAGTYLLECTPVIVGGGTLNDPASAFRSVLHVN